MRSVVLIVTLLAATSLAVPRRVYEPDDVLPEQSSLLQTQAKVHAGVVHPTIKKELKKIKQVAEGSQKGAVKNLEYLMQDAADEDAKSKTPTDGGTQQITTAVTTAKTAITSAINSMKTSLTNDHATAQTDLNTLEAAIDQTKNTIATADLEAIKVHAHQWCTSNDAHATAVTAYNTASADFDAVKNPVIPSAQAFLKNIHPINDCNSGNVAKTDTCPAWTCDLESTLSNAVTSARSSYHQESWDFQEATNTKSTAKGTTDAKQSAYTSAVSTLLLAQASTCTASHGIWTSAKTSFDANNGKRAWMYHSLLKIECYVTHLDGTNTQQSALDTCLSNVNSVDAIKTARFPAATGSGQTYTCPTQTDYINDLKAYGEPDLNLDGTWTPAVTGSCAAITAQGGATSQAPAPSSAQTTTYQDVGVGQCQDNNRGIPCVYIYHDQTNDGCAAQCASRSHCLGYSYYDGSYTACHLHGDSASGLVTQCADLIAAGWSPYGGSHDATEINGADGGTAWGTCYKKAPSSAQTTTTVSAVPIVATGALSVPPTVPTTTQSACMNEASPVVGGDVWCDRDYPFTQLPAELTVPGAKLFQGPHRIPDGDVLTFAASAPGTYWGLLGTRREGTYQTTLSAAGWTHDTAIGVARGHALFKVYKLVSDGSPLTLPAAAGTDTVCVFLWTPSAPSSAASAASAAAPQCQADCESTGPIDSAGNPEPYITPPNWPQCKAKCNLLTTPCQFACWNTFIAGVQTAGDTYYNFGNIMKGTAGAAGPVGTAYNSCEQAC